MVKKVMPETDEKTINYRQMVKNRPDEFNVLIRLLDLPSISIINIITTGLADLVKSAPSNEVIEEFFAQIKKDTFDKINRMRQMKIEIRPKVKYEICVLCEKPFLSDGSGEVPVCLPCLVGYTPKPKETKP